MFFQPSPTKMRLARGVRECDEGHDSGAIVLAASQVLREEGHTDGAYVVKQLQKDPEGLGPKLRRAIDMDLDTPPEKADHMKVLSLIFRRHESVSSYDDWAKTVNSIAGYRLMPCYKTVAKSKIFLHPEVMKSNNITFKCLD